MAARIAVAEDDPDTLALMGALLAANGYEHILIRNDAGAVEALATYTPDLIILDLLFGHEPTGWDILAGIRAHPVLQTKPVILCTAAVEAVTDRVDALHEQETWVLTKPFELEALTSLIQTLLAQHEPPPHG